MNYAFVRRMTAFVLFLNVFMTESVFRYRDYADKSIDLQVMLKMGVWTATFLYTLYFYRLWAGKMLRIDNALQVVLLVMILASCFYAPNFSYSFVSAFTLFSVLFLLLLCSSVLTKREILLQMIYGCTAVVVLSIIVYYVNPSFGRMPEFTDQGIVPGRRLSGIAGSANAVGYISAMCILCLYYYRNYMQAKIPLIYWVTIVVNFAGLLMSNSRTSLTAMMLAIIVASLMRASPARFAALFLSLSIAIVFFTFVDYDALFAALARSGDASEITTGTGRTAIWAVTVDMILQSPLIGWGYASSNYLLPAAINDVGFSASHAHNAYLQVAHSIGLIGLIVFLGVLFTKVYYSVKSGEQVNLALTVFLMLNGMTEPVAFQGVATTTTLALATVLALNYDDDKINETRNPAHQ